MILDNVFCNEDAQWINSTSKSYISSEKIQKYLMCTWQFSDKIRFLERFTTISFKFYLSALWSMFWIDGNKYSKIPAINILTKESYGKHAKIESERYGLLFSNIKRHLDATDRDIKHVKHLLRGMIDKNKSEWFVKYGMPNPYFNFYNVTTATRCKFPIEYVTKEELSNRLHRHDKLIDLCIKSYTDKLKDNQIEIHKNFKYKINGVFGEIDLLIIDKSNMLIYNFEMKGRHTKAGYNKALLQLEKNNSYLSMNYSDYKIISNYVTRSNKYPLKIKEVE